jgi:hypothetical protein
LNEQTKTNGFAGKHDMIMNLAQAMLAGRSLEVFLTEIRAQESKTRSERPNCRRNIPPIKFMIIMSFICASVINHDISKVMGQ